MSKRNKIIYWIATAWLALGMLSTGIMQLLHIKEETDLMIQIGYPLYFLTLLGITKIIGVAILLAPGLLLLKEWAYAGFIFTMAGALYSHTASGSTIGEIAPPLLLLTLTVISWYVRPSNRKINLVNQ